MLLFAIIMYLGCAVCGLLPGMVLSFGVYGLLSFIVNKLCRRKVRCFKYLFFRYDKHNGFTTGRFSPICELSMEKENDTESAAIGAYIAVTILLGLSTVAVFIIVICAHIFLNISVIMGGLLSGIALWFFIDIIHRTILLVDTLQKYKNPSLDKEYHKIAKKFVEGVPIDEIDVPNYTSYGYKNPSKVEIAQYQHFAYLKAVWNFDSNTLHEIVSSMEESIQITYGMREGAFLMSLTSNYYDLLHYYSALNFNKYRAEYIFYAIGKDLKKDKDANGKRTLAFYTFFVLEDPQTAMKLVKEGLELVPEYPIISQRPLEERLLRELEEIILDCTVSKNYSINEDTLTQEMAYIYNNMYEDDEIKDINKLSADELYCLIIQTMDPVHSAQELMHRLVTTNDKRAKEFLLKCVRQPINGDTDYIIKLPESGDSQQIIGAALKCLMNFKSAEIEKIFVDFAVSDDEYLADIAKDYWEDEK